MRINVLRPTPEQMAEARPLAARCFRPPFRYEQGYILDDQGNVLADRTANGDEPEGSALRVRGWGRLQYLPNPEALQDAVGQRIASILSEHWGEEAPGKVRTPVGAVDLDLTPECRCEDCQQADPAQLPRFLHHT